MYISSGEKRKGGRDRVREREREREREMREKEAERRRKRRERDDERCFRASERNIESEALNALWRLMRCDDPFFEKISRKLESAQPRCTILSTCLINSIGRKQIFNLILIGNSICLNFKAPSYVTGHTLNGQPLLEFPMSSGEPALEPLRIKRATLWARVELKHAHHYQHHRHSQVNQRNITLWVFRVHCGNMTHLRGKVIRSYRSISLKIF